MLSMVNTLISMVTVKNPFKMLKKKVIKITFKISLTTTKTYKIFVIASCIQIGLVTYTDNNIYLKPITQTI
jgi:hypothetical protein